MNTIERLAARIKRLEKEARKATTQPQLAHSSIEDGAILSMVQGSVRAIIGQQFDGSSGTAVVNGPIPPPPAAPTVNGAREAARITWSGLFVDGALVPMDFARVEIHASTSSALTGLLAETIVGYYPSPRGGTLTASLTPGIWHFRLVARSESGKASPASAVATAVVKGVDPAVASGINLDAIADEINTVGKYQGRQIYCTTHGRPHWTDGALPDSTWNYADGSTAHTPA